MEDKSIIEFFYNSTLKGSKFYFYCPNMKEKDKTLITNLIYDYEGKISFRFTKNIIIIVETEEVLKTPNFLKMIDNYGDIYFNNNNHIEKFKHNSKKNKIIKIITFKELLLELEAFDNKSINYFIERGLNQSINQEAIISLIFHNKNKTQLESYDFSYQDDKKNVYYDIPYFHCNVPEGFSVFCTDEEYELVINHVNKKGYKLRQKNKNKIKEEIITSEPEPTKKNYICQLCRIQFKNYKEHINSGEHNKNISENKNAFNKLNTTFKRIVDNNFNFNKQKENKGKKIVLNSSHLDFQFLSEKTKTKEKSNYNLRNTIINNKYNDNNYSNYVRKNNNKILDISSPQQQVSSTASCTFKNGLTCLDEISDTNKNKEITKKIKKRKRKQDDDEDFNFEDDFYFKNKRLKV